MTDAVSDLTANTAGTNTESLNQSLDTLSATLDQIAPQLGPTFDGVSRLSQSLNNRNESLAELLKTAGDVTGIFSERSQQVNTLILNANDLLAVLNERRHAIISLLASHLGGVAGTDRCGRRQRAGAGADAGAAQRRDRDAGEEPRQHRQGAARRGEILSDAGRNRLQRRLLQRADPQHLTRRSSCSRSSTTRSDSAAASTPASRRTTPARAQSFRSPSTAFPSQETFPDDGNRKRLVAGTAIALAIALVAGAAFLVRQVFFGPNTITAYFPTATAIYPGDEVRVSGVKVGTIDSIKPEGTQTKMILKVDRGRADSGRRQGRDRRARIWSPPATSSSRPPTATAAARRWRDGAVIPSDRTAVPVEWDEVKTQLMRLATELGPQEPGCRAPRFPGSSTAPRTRWTATATSYARRWPNCPVWQGFSPKAAATSSTSSRTCRSSSPRFATARSRSCCSRTGWPRLTSVLNDSRSDLDAALSDLSTAIGEVQRFVAGSRNQTSEQIQRLANVTQILVDNKLAFENVLHIAPNAIANFNNIYYPNGGSVTGAFSLVQLLEPGASSSAG